MSGSETNELLVRFPFLPIVESMSDPFISFDNNWRYIYVNGAAEKLLRKTSKQVMGKKMTEIFPDAKKSPVFIAGLQALKKNNMVRYEHFSPGMNKWWEVRVYPSAKEVSFYFNDISDRKRIESNLKFLSGASVLLASSLDYEETLESVAKLAVPHIADWCSVEMLDEEGNVVQLTVAHKDPKKVKWALELRKSNPPIDMNEQTGLPNVLRTGKSELYPEITEEMIVAGARNKKELELIRSLGLTSVMIVPIVSKGKSLGAITFVTTETARHFNSSDLDMAEELASRATLAIENARLYQEAQMAVNLRDEFISIASHELKTPLTSLKVYSQILGQRLKGLVEEEDVKGHLNKIDSQIDKLNKLIRDLLDVSKVQRGSLDLEEENFDLRELVKEQVDSIQTTTGKHQIIFSPGNKTMIYGDKDRIGQIVVNLLNNAIKYSPDAEKVKLDLSKSAKEVVLAVKDYGLGIEKDSQDKIFERFYQANESKNKTYPGLGIGLYISSEIAKRHGGRIKLKSQIGKGSTFYLCLPLRRARK
jgi:PAS domain S-box-containing protein